MKYAIRHIAEIVGGSFLQFRGDDPVEHLLLDKLTTPTAPILHHAPVTMLFTIS